MIQILRLLQLMEILCIAYRGVVQHIWHLPEQKKILLTEIPVLISLLTHTLPFGHYAFIKEKKKIGMCLKLPDTQLFHGRTGCHSHLNKPRATNSQRSGQAISVTLRKNTTSVRQITYKDYHFTCPMSKNPQHPTKTQNLIFQIFQKYLHY